MSYQLGSVESDGRAELYADPRDHRARPRFRGLVASLVALAVITVFAGGLGLGRGILGGLAVAGGTVALHGGVFSRGGRAVAW